MYTWTNLAALWQWANDVKCGDCTILAYDRRVIRRVQIRWVNHTGDPAPIFDIL